MILRSATDLAVGFTSNETERGVQPVKVQQRTSGGRWRILQVLADFAVFQSYLSTAAKWGIDAPPTHSSGSSSKAPDYQPPSGPAE
jgi:transposase